MEDLIFEGATCFNNNLVLQCSSVVLSVGDCRSTFCNIKIEESENATYKVSDFDSIIINNIEFRRVINE